MPSKITQGLRLKNAENFTEAFTEISNDNLYVTIGKTSQWADENIPEFPVDSPKYVAEMYQNIIGIKKVQAGDVRAVCPRFDYNIGVVYDEWDDDLEVVGGVNPDNGNPYRYYVFTPDYHVYKCISNNGGAVSTVQPSGVNLGVFQTEDGYIWKYLFTVNTDDAINYLSPDWIPVKRLLEDDGSDQWSVQTAAIDGAIYQIAVENGGSGYDKNDPPSVIISGDGFNASADVIVNDSGVITGIVVTNPGSGYTYADVVINSSGVSHTGSTAIVRAIMSPRGGHGYDAVNELGASHRMIKVTFAGDEGGNLPLNTDYRQFSLISNPYINQQGKHIKLSNITGIFDAGDIVTDGASASGTVIQFDYYNQKLILSSVSGTFANGATISNGEANATVDSVENGNIPATGTFIQPEEIVSGTGNVIYINNRTRVTRFAEQDERVRLVISF